MLRVTEGVIETIQQASRNTYPDEFLALLGGSLEAERVEELVMVPAVYGKNFSTLRIDLVPFDASIIGSIHSHPSQHNAPSAGDRAAFAKLGQYHLIAAYPYVQASIAAYNARGEHIPWKVE